MKGAAIGKFLTLTLPALMLTMLAAGAGVEAWVPVDPYEHERLHYFGRRDHHLVPGTVTINAKPYVCDLDQRRFREREDFVAHLRAVHRAPAERIPDLLALVGDAADGYPGIPGIGKVTAARLVDKHGPLEEFPPEVLGDQRELALLFKDLATLRASAEVVGDVDELRWRGPKPAFAACTERLSDRRLLERALAAAE